jgi:hypothetical protein
VLGIPCVEGDYFEVRINQAADENFTLVSALSHFTIEVAETTDTVPSLRTVVASLPAKWRGVQLVLDSATTPADLDPAVVVDWDSAVSNTDAMWEGVTNPSRITIPAGVRRVSFDVMLLLTSGTADTGDVDIQLHKNGSFHNGTVTQWAQDGTSTRAQLTVPDELVAEADYFEVFVRVSGADVTIAVNTDSFFRASIVEFNSSTDAVQAYIAVSPEVKSATVGTGGTGTQNIADATFTPITFWDTLTQGGNSFDPGDDGPPQRFWLGVDQTFVDGDVDVGNDEIDNLTAHGFQTGEGPVTLTSSGTLPAGLATATKYWIIRIDANTIAFADSRADALAGSKHTITAAAGTGTHTIETAEKLVIPAGVSKVKLLGSAFLDTPVNLVRWFVEWYEGTALTWVPDQVQSQAQGSSSTSARAMSASGILDVTEGEFYVLQAFQDSDGAEDIDGVNGANMFQIEVVEESRAITYPGVTVTPPHRGVLLGDTSDQSITNVTFEAIDWDTEIRDTDGFHEGVTNPSRITIPAGLGIRKVRLTASIHWAADVDGERTLSVNINGAALVGGRVEDGQAGSASRTSTQSWASPVIDVVDNDYFEVLVRHAGGAALNALTSSTLSHFSLEVVETDENAFPPEPIEWFVHGAPATTDDLFMKVATRRFTVADALAGSEAYANGAPSGGAVVYDVERNGTKIGDITFADTANTATFSTVAAQQYVFDVGDRLEIVSPANVQSMTDIAFSLWGWRSRSLGLKRLPRQQRC